LIERGLANEENKALCGSFGAIWPLDLELLHPGHDGADEVDVEDGVDVDQVEGHRNGQKAKAIDSRHGVRFSVLIFLRCSVRAGNAWALGYPRLGLFCALIT
jgi:hypothetical protein